MSRVGKLPITVPKNVNVTLSEETCKVKGPHGELSQLIPKEISVAVSDDQVIVTTKEETRKARQKHGLVRSLVNNMIIGVSEKFEKKMQMIGVGYRAQVQGKKLTLLVGYSHPVEFEIPDDIEVAVEANTNLTIKGANKAKVGLLASQIRATRPPEPYKGKGIRYVDEVVLRKAGKSGK